MARLLSLVAVVLGVVLLLNPLYTLGWNDRYVHDVEPATVDDEAVVAYEALSPGSRTAVRRAIAAGRYVAVGVHPDTRFSYPTDGTATTTVAYAGATYRLATSKAPGDPLGGVLVVLAVVLFGLGTTLVGVRSRLTEDAGVTALLVTVVAVGVVALGPLTRYPVGVDGWRSLALLSPLVPVAALAVPRLADRTVG